MQGFTQGKSDIIILLNLMQYLCTPTLLSYVIISDQLQRFCLYCAPSLLHAQQLPGVLDPVLTENQESGKTDTMACHFKELVFS